MANYTLEIREVKRITECPICAEKLCNPKVLPCCFHTFCLICLEEYCNEQGNRDVMPCPMCGAEFSIPDGGLSELGTNPFMEQLTTATASSKTVSRNVIYCDACHEEGQHTVEVTSFCMECQSSMCSRCSSIHETTEATLDHQLLPHVKPSQRKCDKHSKERLRFYCKECRTIVCNECVKSTHTEHIHFEIDQFSENIRKNVEKYSCDANEIINNVDQQSVKIDQQIETFTHDMKQMVQNIKKKADEIKQLVDKQTTILLEEVNSYMKSTLESKNNAKEELRGIRKICENFKRFSAKVLEDLVQKIYHEHLADELKIKTRDLKSNLIPETEDLPDITFIPSDLHSTMNSSNCVGKISVREISKDSSILQTARLQETEASKISVLQMIGQGGYGVVHKVSHSDLGLVAYKKMNIQYIKECDLVVLRHEAELHMSLNHVNIIKCHAVVLEPGNYGILFELAEHGELRDYLKKNDELGIKLRKIFEVASGMNYLHGIKPHPVLHGDLKIQNVLVGDNFQAKICDFGFSKWKNYSQSRSKHSVRQGTSTHIPPEYLRDSKLRKTEPFDVYSFAICAWEILTLEIPFENAGGNQGLIEAWVMRGQRPDFEILPSNTPEIVKHEIIGQCWDRDAAKRPTFENIVSTFENFYSGTPSTAAARETRTNVLRRRISDLRKGINALRTGTIVPQTQTSVPRTQTSVPRTQTSVPRRTSVLRSILCVYCDQN